MNHGLAMKPRKYSDILVGQFEIGNVVRINRKNDESTMPNKIFDFSIKTINHLRVEIAIPWISVMQNLVELIAR